MKKIALLSPSKAKKGHIVSKYMYDSLRVIDVDFNVVVWTDKIDSYCYYSNLGFECRVVDSLKLETDNDISQLEKMDFLVVCGWGYLISSRAISSPRIASLNCHSSYLPDYKGGSVYLFQWANCEQFGGATIHFLTEEFDRGNIIAQQMFKINSYDKPSDILVRASEITGPLVFQALYSVLSGAKGIPQASGRYFKKISKKKLFFYRILNKLFSIIGVKKLYTPFKGNKCD